MSHIKTEKRYPTIKDHLAMDQEWDRQNATDENPHSNADQAPLSGWMLSAEVPGGDLVEYHPNRVFKIRDKQEKVWLCIFQNQQHAYKCAQIAPCMPGHRNHVWAIRNTSWPQLLTNAFIHGCDGIQYVKGKSDMINFELEHVVK